MKRVAKKLAPSAEQTVIDPYLPKSGNLGYRVSRYELALEYKVAINRLSGSATIALATRGLRMADRTLRDREKGHVTQAAHGGAPC